MRLTVAQVDKLKQLIHDVQHRNGPYHCDYEDFADEVWNMLVPVVEALVLNSRSLLLLQPDGSMKSFFCADAVDYATMRTNLDRMTADHDIQAVNSIAAPDTRGVNTPRNATVDNDDSKGKRVHDIQRTEQPHHVDEQEMDEFGPYTRE